MFHAEKKIDAVKINHLLHINETFNNLPIISFWGIKNILQIKFRLIFTYMQELSSNIDKDCCFKNSME